MNDKPTGLENFVERHRADFDAFEPRPDLWDDIELQLDAPAAGPALAPSLASTPANDDDQPAPLRVVKLHPAASTDTPAPARRLGWLPRPGLAAAVAALVLAGMGAIWSRDTHPGGWVASGPVVQQTTAPAAGRTPFGFEAAPVASAAAASPRQRLTQEVRRMESYFAVQIEERQAELRRLEASTAAAGPAADWQRELTALDSTYRQLKTELYRNPDPAVVLDAMNRNLQIRLDILNQQTRTREQIQEYHSQPLTTADGQPQP